MRAGKLGLLALLALLAAASLLAAPAAAAPERAAAASPAGPLAGLSRRLAAAAPAQRKIASLRLRLHGRSRGAAHAESALEAGAAAALQAASHSRARVRSFLPAKVNRRGAGGKAGRAGGNAGFAGGNAGFAAGSAGQSGRKGGDAAGTGGQSGRKGGDAAGVGGQSGRKGGDASGVSGQSGRKGGDLPPVSPITGSPPPDADNVMTLVGVKRDWPIRIYLRNQGDAATCWAHMALTLLELRQQMSLSYNLLKNWYSVDQITKCVKNDGAGGGSPLDALEYIITGELMTDAEVRAGKPIHCRTIDWKKTSSNVGHYTGTVVVQPCVNPGENCARMADYEYVMEHEFMLTPMLAYVDASQWHTYAPKVSVMNADAFAEGNAPDYSGVAFPTSKCSMDPAKGDHLVLLLGTVTCPKTKKKYWRVYNSWGREWGVNGYIYLPYEVNACGLANYPVGLNQNTMPGLLSAPMFMLPKTMTQAEGDRLAKGVAIGTSGGKELYDYQMQRAAAKKLQ